MNGHLAMEKLPKKYSHSIVMVSEQAYEVRIMYWFAYETIYTFITVSVGQPFPPFAESARRCLFWYYYATVTVFFSRLFLGRMSVRPANKELLLDCSRDSEDRGTVGKADCAFLCMSLLWLRRRPRRRARHFAYTTGTNWYTDDRLLQGLLLLLLVPTTHYLLTARFCMPFLHSSITEQYNNRNVICFLVKWYLSLKA